MNQEHLEDELLQRHFDGDLRPSRAADVSRHLSSCAECSARHRALGALHGMVALAAEDSARGVDFDALYGRIERGIREQRAASLSERLSVWWRDLAEQKPGQVWVPAAAALAAAAVLVVVYRGEPQQPAARRPAPKPEVAVAATAINSEIVQVDFGSNAGTVFEIALADGQSTPVVWINDDL